MTGPAEVWFCKCTDRDGNKVLKPASAKRCPLCKMKAPWNDGEARLY
jgi:hypothetical protein